MWFRIFSENEKSIEIIRIKQYIRKWEKVDFCIKRIFFYTFLFLVKQSLQSIIKVENRKCRMDHSKDDAQ